MKHNKEVRLAVLGMGYLMEYIYPCYEALLGERMQTQMIAVTADEADLPRKQQRCAFPVLLHDSAAALERIQPDYILLAPPPKLAPALVEEQILPYFKCLRAAGKSLPAIFAFPPNPAGDYYLQTLGEDIRVVNVLPNMVSEIAGEKLHGEGLTYLTYPQKDNWTAEEKAFVSTFFAPLGGTIEVPPAQVSQMLAGTVTVHNISEVIFTITDALNSRGKVQVSHRQVAQAMRAYHRNKWQCENQSYACSQSAVDAYLYFALRKVTFHWFQGIQRFYLESGLSEQTAREILVSLLDLHLQVHQREERAEIEHKTTQHATKGGVLDKGCQMFYRLVETGLYQAFSVYPDLKLSDEWCDWLEQKAYQITKIVSDHGSRLSTGKTCDPFAVVNHAALFGMIARHTLQSNLPDANEALAQAVIEYARERGARMRQRCDRFGDQPSMLSYKVYCEWCPEQEVFDSVTLQTSPVHKTEIYACPWSRVWAADGDMPYVRHYCDYVDFNLVKGFNEQLNLEMPTNLARGDRACAFTWCGADLTNENAAWIETRRRELLEQITCGWEYHTAHLYHTMLNALRRELREGGNTIEQMVRAEYSARFTEESLSVIDGFARIDFKAANGGDAK